MLLIVVTLIISAVCLISCGSPRTSIRVTNRADGTDTKISVSQGDGGSTSVTINPSLNASIDSIGFAVRRD